MLCKDADVFKCCFVSSCSDLLLLLKHTSIWHSLTSWNVFAVSDDCLRYLSTTPENWIHKPCYKMLFTPPDLKHTRTQCFYILKRSKMSLSVTSSVMFPTHRERQLLEDRGGGGGKKEVHKEKWRENNEWERRERETREGGEQEKQSKEWKMCGLMK